MSLTLKISIPVHKEGSATVNRGQAATAIAGRRSRLGGRPLRLGAPHGGSGTQWCTSFGILGR